MSDRLPYDLLQERQLTTVEREKQVGREGNSCKAAGDKSPDNAAGYQQQTTRLCRHETKLCSAAWNDTSAGLVNPNLRSAS